MHAFKQYGAYLKLQQFLNQDFNLYKHAFGRWMAAWFEKIKQSIHRIMGSAARNGS